MNIGLLHTIIREDEKKIIAACEKQNITLTRIDVRKHAFYLTEKLDPIIQDCDIILDRSVSLSKGLIAAYILEGYGKKVINSASLVELCGDKTKTSLLLARNNIPTLKTVIALSEESALEAIEQLGYPVVLKPPVGSWGRLLAKINDRDSAEAILEHKSTLGSYQHEIFYIQEYVKKPGRDIRVVVVGKEPIAAMYRSSEHWITNAARGGEPTLCKITTEIRSIIDKVITTFGEGLMGIDLFETEEGLKVVEVNAGMEFKALSQVAEIDIADTIIDYLKQNLTY
ncbi:MAG: lysine biosynthesis protein LysX [bacterium]